jgi:hypothetical protein
MHALFRGRAPNLAYVVLSDERPEPLEGLAYASVIDQDAAHRLGGGL